MRGNPANPGDWAAFARRDLHRARKDLADGEPLRATATLRQAAEKALKGWLIAKGWELVKTHDVTALVRAAIQRGADLEWSLTTAASVTEECFAERYPGDFDPPPTEKETRVFLTDVENLFEQLFPGTWRETAGEDPSARSE